MARFETLKWKFYVIAYYITFFIRSRILCQGSFTTFALWSVKSFNSPTVGSFLLKNRPNACRLVDGLTSFGLKLSKKIHSYGDVKRSLHKFGQRIARRPIHHRLAPSNLLELSTCVLTVCFRGHFNYFSKPRNKSQFSFQNSKKNFKFQKFNILGTGCRRGGRGCTSNHVSRI